MIISGSKPDVFQLLQETLQITVPTEKWYELLLKPIVNDIINYFFANLRTEGIQELNLLILN